MDIVQEFYDSMASSYHKLFEDWQASTKEQALVLDRIFKAEGFDEKSGVLDCACGIGTQCIGLASLGYTDITASDISTAELDKATENTKKNNADIAFQCADFRALAESFSQQFDIIIAMDNALPHMMSKADLKTAAESITARLKTGGIFVASIRDYDSLLSTKPVYSPPYIHKTEIGQRVSFQTWEWSGDIYKLIQYIIDDGEKLGVEKYECMYRAVRRDELTSLLKDFGCKDVKWLFSEESGYYQPVLVARK